MTVKLLNKPDLSVCDLAIGKCWMKEAKDPIKRMDRVINQHKHSSTAEHIIYQFDIDGISRAVLQELSRHRMQSLTVKSSRYTLTELKEEEPFNFGYNYQVSLRSYQDNSPHFEVNILRRASKYIVLTGHDEVDAMSTVALENLRMMITRGVSNDKAKYCMPECYKTSLVLTVNARSLQNFLVLRTSKSALWEIRQLAHAMYDQIPEDHRFLFIDHVTK